MDPVTDQQPDLGSAPLPSAIGSALLWCALDTALEDKLSWPDFQKLMRVSRAVREVVRKLTRAKFLQETSAYASSAIRAGTSVDSIMCLSGTIGSHVNRDLIIARIILGVKNREPLHLQFPYLEGAVRGSNAAAVEAQRVEFEEALKDERLSVILTQLPSRRSGGRPIYYAKYH